MAGTFGGRQENAGATPLLTPPVLDRYLIALARCRWLEDAAEFIGVTQRTAYRWKKRGEKALRYGLNGEEQIYAEFVRRSAQVLAEKRALSVEVLAKSDDPKWHAWLLERSAPHLWGSYADELREMKKDIASIKMRGS